MTRRKKKRPVSLAEPITKKVSVENPDWRPDLDGEKAFPRHVMADKNTRESAIETLFARRYIGSAQKLAADKFRAFWEAAGGTSSSIDFASDRVDGGRGDPVVSKLIAIQELRRIRYKIGERGYEVLEAVCGEGKALSDLSPHKREKQTMADNLRADLDDVATMFGLQTRQRHLQKKA
jgi:hypothetical protein